MFRKYLLHLQLKIWLFNYLYFKKHWCDEISINHSSLRIFVNLFVLKNIIRGKMKNIALLNKYSNKDEKNFNVAIIHLGLMRRFQCGTFQDFKYFLFQSNFSLLNATLTIHCSRLFDQSNCSTYYLLFSDIHFHMGYVCTRINSLKNSLNKGHWIFRTSWDMLN